MRNPILFWLATSLCLATVASGEARLELGLDASVRYDDNIVFSSSDELSDFSLRPGPLVAIEDDRDQLTWRVAYSPTYEKFLRYSEVDGWNHRADMNLAWRVSPRTTLEMSDRYGNFNRYSTVFEQTGAEGPIFDPGIALLGRRFEQNDLGGSLIHLLTPLDRLELTTTWVYTDRRTDLFVGNEADVLSATMGWLRTLGANDQAGLSFAFTQQQLEPDGPGPKSKSDFYNISLQWVHIFSPTLNLQASAGPALVRSPRAKIDPLFEDQPAVPVITDRSGVTGPALVDSCPTFGDGTPFLSSECDALAVGSLIFPGILGVTTDLALIGDAPDADASNLTYFAYIVLSKEWKTVSASLRYSRDASTAIDATGEVRDLVFGRLVWRPTDRWLVVWQAMYERRELESKGVFLVTALAPTGIQGIGQAIGLRAVEFDSQIDIDQFTVSVHVDYSWSRRVTLYASAYWLEQRTRGDVPFSRSAERITFTLGVRFFLDPIPLPI